MASTRSQLTDEERLARDVFTRLAAQCDEFEAYAHPHAGRIARLADELAQLFHLGRADRASLRVAALAHDLGEMAMRRDYLRRAGPLNEDERLDLARHPVIGEQEAARSGADRGAQLLVRWHHEWWSGAGYPDALRREQIPLGARILRVADSYAALTDDRPHRRAATEEEARKHLAEWAGIEFDPHVVRAFLTLKNLPELRSYARRDAGAQTGRDAGAQTSDAPRPTTHAHAAEPEPPPPVLTDPTAAPIFPPRDEPGGYSSRGLGGRVPEQGTNPYARASDPATTDPTPSSRDGERGAASSDQSETDPARRFSETDPPR